jgi:2-oxo-4-hydroxy-4-carboxy-5-ureidoimidazoline decarboxylase
MMAVLEAASTADKLALIRAHPELAGKAAIAKTLTAESNAEQASAGLDKLTPEEFERFHAAERRLRPALRLPVHHRRAAERQDLDPGGHAGAPFQR